jgi:hypothetical protein
MAMVVMTSSLSVAKNSAVAVAAFQAELAVESTVQKVIYDLITLGPQNAWLKNGQRSTVTIDGGDVTVSVININGLVDVNVADDAALRRIVAVTLPPGDTVTLTSAIAAARPILDYVSLASLEGMSPEKFEALFPYITLYSRQTLPSFASAPCWIVDALHLKVAGSSVFSDTSGVAGNAFRIEAIARTKAATSRMLAVELLVTGRLDQPYWVYDWSWYSHGQGR